ncbi:MAG: winged helix-turn-helix transcriptional regulator, partial [Bacteroidales bacterium]|nr:winged helix-turn-helix transcriptional regulator [Bacteroidales bacterium]
SPIELTYREYSILCLLAQRPNKYFSRDEILSAVWPNNALVNDRSVDVHIARLRKKMGNEGRRIVNRTGFGYAISTLEPKN